MSSRLLAVLLVLLTYVTQSHASLRAQWNFEGGDPFAGFILEGVPPTVVQDPHDQSNKVMRLEMEKGGDRSEVRWVTDLVSHEESWIGFRMLRPDAGHNTFVCNMQVGPIRPKDGKWIGLYQLQTVRKSGKWVFKKYNNSASSDTKRSSDTFDFGPIAWGKWSDWVVHVRLARDQTGEIEVWMNGKKIHACTEFNAVSSSAIALKWGAYIDIGNAATDSTAVYFDNIKIGSASSNYAEVDPSK